MRRTAVGWKHLRVQLIAEPLDALLLEHPRVLKKEAEKKQGRSLVPLPEILPSRDLNFWIRVPVKWDSTLLSELMAVWLMLAAFDFEKVGG
jgi:hypothetical protein